MGKGSYQLLVDWNNDGDFTDAHDDITSAVLSLSWERGRDYASQLQGKSRAGKLTATLVNTDGKYSPNNTSSALTGNILPGRTVRLLAGPDEAFPYEFPISFEDQVKWQGKLDRIKPSPAAKGVKTATLTALGVLGFINQFDVQLATQTSRRTDQAIGDILDGVGWPADDRNLDTGLTTMTRFWISGKKAIDAIRLVEETEAGFIVEDRDGDVGFQNRHHRLTASASTTSQATFSDASGATYTYSALEQTDPLSTIVNHVEASSKVYDTGSVAVLWTHPETGSSSPTLAPGEAKIFEATYPNPSTATNAVEVNAWTTPAATTDVLANTASDGTGTNLTSDITIAASKTAQRMAITLTNSATGSDVYLTKIQARGTPVTVKDPVVVRAIDTASQTAHGDRKYTAATEFIPSSAEAQDWCDYQMAIYGSPIPILKMTIQAGDDDNRFQTLVRDISDRITVVATNDAGMGINADFFIEAERHTVSRQNHVVQWLLSPASGGYSQFWVLGTSVLGTDTVPAF